MIIIDNVFGTILTLIDGSVDMVWTVVIGRDEGFGCGDDDEYND